MGLPVTTSATLTAGLRADFDKTYIPMYKSILAKMAGVMQLGIPSDKLTEIFAYHESAPHPQRWVRGVNRATKGFNAIQYSVTNKKWEVGVEWHEDDREDDQIKSLFPRAQAAGQNFATLHERVFFQILLSAVDAALLPAIPTAPDGAALFATTAGGVARFGASSGNLLSGTGVALASAIRTDFFSAIQQFKLFQDTEGQPLLGGEILDGRYQIIYGVGNEKVFREAFVQGRTLDAGEKGAAESNIIMDSGAKVSLQSTQRITDDDWFVFLDGLPIKPIFQTERRALRSIDQTVQNSDRARATGIEALLWDARYGYGINTAYGALKVNN